MRAAVLLCTQELINGVQVSSFQQFQCTLPPVKNAAIAVAAAANFLRAKGLMHTLSVLEDEVDPAVLAQGESELAALLQDPAPGANAIAQIQAKAGH
jgi:hypothetical protein